MKILVVYYSLTGNTKLLAEIIATELKAEILELKPEKELNPGAFSRFIWGGAQAVMNLKPKLHPYNQNPLDYDLIILCSPVWAWRLSPPVHSFIERSNLVHKKIAIVLSSGGEAIKALERTKSLLLNNNIIDSIWLTEPKTNNTEEQIQQVKAWAQGLLSK